MATENVGGISMDAVIDLQSFQQSVNQLKNAIAQIDTKNLEAGFTNMEGRSKAAAGSILQLQQEAQQLRAELERINPETQAFTTKAQDLNNVMLQLTKVQTQAQNSLTKYAQATKDAGNATNTTSIATKAWGVALGVLGAQSIQAVVMKVISLAQESLNLAIQFDGVQARAKAIYGTSFPQMEQAAGSLATQFHRSYTQMLDFATGFGTILDSIGLSTKQIDNYSTQLTALTENLGKAFPDKSDVDIYNAVSTAIEGNLRGLRSLGIVVNDKVLQDYAETEGIKTKVSKMDEEQKAMLITQYLLGETQKLQKAGADSTDSLGNSVKSLSADWSQFLAELGTDISPAMDAIVKVMSWGLGTIEGLIQMVTNSMSNMVSNMGRPKQGLFDSKGNLSRPALSPANRAIALAKPNTVPFGPDTLQDTLSAAGVLPKGFWDPPSDSGAGGQKVATQALDDAKKIQTEIDKLNKDILDSLNKQITDHKAITDQLHDTLETKKKIGTITSQEELQLDRLNRLTEYHKDAVKDATDAWTAQVDVVKKLQDEVDNLAQEPIKLAKDLKDKLDTIDADTHDQMVKKAEELMKQQVDLNQKKQDGNITNDEQAQLDAANAALDKLKNGGSPADTTKASTIKQLKEYLRVNGPDPQIQKQLDDAIAAQKTTTSYDKTAYTEAKKATDANLDPFQQIQADADAKKVKAAQDNAKQLEQVVANLQIAQKDLAKAQATLKDKVNDVTAALAQQVDSNAKNYKQIEAATATHVANEVAQISILQAKLEALARAYGNVPGFPSDPSGSGGGTTKAGAPVQRATGGMVYGPGTGTSDSIPALLSNGEYVVRAAAVQVYRPMLEAINSMRFQVPKFAAGGYVSSVNQSKTANVTVNNYGEAANVMARPDLVRWHTRMALR